MAAKYLFLAFVSVVGAAPGRVYPTPEQLQQIPTYNYYLDNPQLGSYSYTHEQIKQAASNVANEAPAKLETLEPDSEVELIPGAQQPQQPPQTPVQPNIPGLAPGQRVFIVHMPVPGYRPGTIGGYQPVYIVAAAPQGNSYTPNYTPNYAPNGYQNTLYLDPSTGQVVSPVLGYQRGAQPAYPQYQPQPGLVYQNPNLVYQAQPQQALRPALPQLIALHPASPVNRSNANAESNKHLAQTRESTERKEVEDQRRSDRPTPQRSQPLKA